MALNLDNIISGDDDIGYDDVGFRNPFRGRRRRRMPAPRPAPSPARALMPSVPGTPARDFGLYPAGFGIATFVAATGSGAITVTANPQGPFKAARITATVIRTGATAALAVPLLTDLRVGMVPAVMTVDGVPVEMFTPNAVDTNLKLPPTTPGVLYSASLRLSAPVTGTDSVVVILSMIGGSWQ